MTVQLTAKAGLSSAKGVVFALCLLPAGLLLAGALRNDLGANPVETLIRDSGDWTLRLLLITLALTPLRTLLGQTWPLRFRRMLGLFAFFYAVLHLAIYLMLDRQLVFSTILEDIVKRPYITVGFTAVLLLLPLALTSTKGWMRRLGSHWKRLHRLVYIAAALGVLHYLWLVRADLLEPGIYAAILALLLALRLPVLNGRIRAIHRPPPVRRVAQQTPETHRPNQ